jgi:hypothetical protein
VSGDDTLWEDGAAVVFRPSYSPTYIYCAGSLRPSMNAIDQGSWEAAEGTVWHDLMARWQREGEPPTELQGTRWQLEGYEGEIDEEMFTHGAECIARATALLPPKSKVFVEQRIDISDITPIPDQSGTADRFILSPGVLELIDWKYGKGIQVFAFKNTQLLMYVWGIFKAYDSIYHFKSIRMWIFQPRFDHYDLWEVSREELIEWANWLRIRNKAAWKRNAPRTVGPKQCQWCKVRTDCKALEIARTQMVDEGFDYEHIGEEVTVAQMEAVTTIEAPKTLPDPTRLTTLQLAHIKKYRKLMETWFKQIDATLIERATVGGEQEIIEEQGWKLVQGRSRRRYKDEDRAASKYQQLGLGPDDIYETKLRSPNQLKKALSAIGVKGKLQTAFFKLLCEMPPGQPTLVPTGDNREALALEEPFDEYEDAI